MTGRGAFDCSFFPVTKILVLTVKVFCDFENRPQEGVRWTEEDQIRFRLGAQGHSHPSLPFHVRPLRLTKTSHGEHDNQYHVQRQRPSTLPHGDGLASPLQTNSGRELASFLVRPENLTD